MRGPSAPPESGHARSYEPKAKTSRAQRESEGIVEPGDRVRQLQRQRRRIELVLTKLGLKRHPQKTRRVELTAGREGVDLLGCHLRQRMSGRLRQQEEGLRRYGLQRWPSRKAMNRVRARVRELTPRQRCHEDVRGVIAELNPVLRGWGQYSMTGDAADHFTAVDDCMVKRLRSLRVMRAGRILRAGQTQRWNRDGFESLETAPPARRDQPPGQTSWQQQICVMLRAEGPLVSRVREIRMHGLNGGAGSVLDLLA